MCMYSCMVVQLWWYSYSMCMYSCSMCMCMYACESCEYAPSAPLTKSCGWHLEGSLTQRHHAPRLACEEMARESTHAASGVKSPCEYHLSRVLPSPLRGGV